MRLIVPDLLPGRTYAIQVRAKNGERVSEWSNRYSFITMSDTIAPKTPTNATWVASGDSFYGTWDRVDLNAENDEVIIDRYELELVATGMTKIVSVPATNEGTPSYSLSFEQNRALFGTQKPIIAMRVRAVDVKDLNSPWTNAITATNAAPANPTAVTATAGLNQIALLWTPPTDLDLVGYNVYVGASKLTFTNSTSYVYQTTTYSSTILTVKAVDKFLQESSGADSNAVTPVSPFLSDTTAPSTPTGLGAVITNNATGIGSRAAITWTMSSPPSDLAGFYVRYRKVGDTAYSNVIFQKDDRAGTIELQSAYTNYEFQIKAFDFSQNESAWSSTVTATSPSNGVPANVSGLVSTPGRDAIRYDWTPVADADLKEYEITFSTSSTFASGNTTFRTGGNTMTVSGLTPATTYYARIRAVDQGGLVSTAWSATDTETTLSASSTVSVSDLTGGTFGAIGMTLGPGSSMLLNGGHIKSNTYTGTTQATNPSGAGFYLGNDGLRIDDGIVDAKALKSGSAIIGDLVIGRSTDALGEIKSFGYTAGTAGFRLHKTGLEINSGVIAASALRLQLGSNVIPTQFADFEFNPAYYNSSSWTPANSVSSIITTTPWNGSQCANIARGASASQYFTYFGASATDYNTPVEAGSSYIVSAYIRNRSATATNAFFGLKWDNAANSAMTAVSIPTSSATWVRYSFVTAAAPSGVTKALFFAQSTTTTAGANFDIDGIQIEKQITGTTTPSAWNPPSSTRIDGGAIRTGSIRSTETAQVIQVTPVYNEDGTEIVNYGEPVPIADPTGRPAWLINTTGGAEFSNLSIRGNVTVGNPDSSMLGDTSNNVVVVADTSSGSNVVSGAESGTFKALDVGLAISGSGIPASTTITEVTDSTSIKMSNNATATATAVSLTVTRNKRIVSTMSSANYVPGIQGWSLRSDGYADMRELSADSVDGRVLKSSAVDGTHLNGLIDVQSTLQVGENISISNITGITIVSPVGTTTFPTDDSGIILAGDVIANSLTVIDNFALRGVQNEIAKGSGVILSAGTTPPKTPPSVTTGWRTSTISEGYNPRGLAKSPVTSANPRWLTAGSLFNGYVFDSVYNSTTGDYDLVWGSGFNLDDMGRTEVTSGIGGVTTIGNNVYILCNTDEVIPGTYNGRWYVYHINYSGGPSGTYTYNTRYMFEPSGYTGGNSPYQPVIGNNGTDIIVAQASGYSGNLIFYTHAGGNSWTSVSAKNPDGSFYNSSSYGRGVQQGNFDFGSNRIVHIESSDGIAKVFNSSGTRQLNDDFPIASTDTRGLAWDSTDGIFMTRTATKVYHHTAIVDTSTPYQIANTWVKADGTGPDFAANETVIGTVRSVTLKKRANFTVTTAPIPNVISDITSPDATNIYIGQGGSMYLNATPRSGNSVTFSSVALSGTTPPGAGTFGAGQSGWIRSFGADVFGSIIDINGDGSGRAGPYNWNASGALPWITFTPDLQASTTNPSNEVATGQYFRAGDMVDFEINITLGTSIGSGVYEVPLPVSAATGIAPIGNAMLRRGSGGFIGTVAMTNTGGSAVQFVGDSIGRVTSTTQAWASGDTFRIVGRYRAA